MDDRTRIKLDALLSWFLLPVYVWQGLGVRRRTLRMPPPQAKAFYKNKAKGEPLRILLVGDSSAAGTGVETFGQSLGGHLLAMLEENGKAAELRLAGNNSATCSQIRDHVVPHLAPENYDVILLNIGTNDAKNLHTGNRFKRDFGTLIYALKTRFPDSILVWSGILDLEQIPSLPRPLNWVLGARSRLMMQIGKQLCNERGAFCPPTNWRIIEENFSSDGFHASNQGYREWAKEVINSKIFPNIT